MSIETRIDERARRITQVLSAAANGAQATRVIVQMVAERPELAGWDWVHDVRLAEGRATLEDVQETAAAFAIAPPGETFTVFVSADRNLALWCQVMDHQIPGRRHLTAPSVEQAHADLDRRRARLSPARGSG